MQYLIDAIGNFAAQPWWLRLVVGAAFGGLICCTLPFFFKKTRAAAMFHAETGGEISAQNAQLPKDLGFQLGRAESGGKITMDNVKFIKE